MNFFIILMIDDYHNVHAKKVPAQLVTSCAIHMASCLVDIQQVPAVLQPPNVSIHRPVRVNVKGKESTCYGGIFFTGYLKFPVNSSIV